MTQHVLAVDKSLNHIHILINWLKKLRNKFTVAKFGKITPWNLTLGYFIRVSTFRCEYGAEFMLYGGIDHQNIWP